MRATIVGIICALALVVVALALPADAKAPGDSVRVAATGDYAERYKTIPIGRKPSQKSRVIISLGPGELGNLADGDLLESMAELEVTTCLKANKLHGGSNKSCLGRVYGYDPKVRGQLVLAAEPDDMSRAKTTPVSAAHKLTCRQKQPNRNHHCVLVIPPSDRRIDAARLACDPRDCRLNLVVSAWHHSAKPGDKLIIGAAKDGKQVKQDKGRVSAVRFRPGTMQRAAVERLSNERVKKLQIRASSPKESVVYSVPLRNLRAGEQIIVSGKAIIKIGHHPYNALVQSMVEVSFKPNKSKRSGWMVNHFEGRGQPAEGNGFNCTQGRSAHRNPCVVRKFGVLRVLKDVSRTVYLNFMVGLGAQGDLGDDWRPGDKAKVANGGYLEIERYSPSYYRDGWSRVAAGQP